MTEKEIQERKKLIQKLATNYRWKGKPVPQKDKLLFTTVNGIDFYMVGHNSSHEFYLGLDDSGNYWARSFGEVSYNYEDDEPEYGENVYQLNNLEDAYLGHL